MPLKSISDLMFCFDADGVLFHTFTPSGAFAWSENIEKDLGISRPVLEKIFSPAWNRILRGERSVRAYIEDLFESGVFPIPADRFLDYWLSHDNRINEDVARYMDRFPSCIASNQPLERTLKFEDWFKGRAQHVFASSRLGVMKPDPAYFHQIEATLQKRPDQLCLIDDDPLNCEGARTLGWMVHRFMDEPSLKAFFDSLTSSQGPGGD